MSSRKVFAHYMVGLTNDQPLSQWTADIRAAHSAGIDGFALNIGPSDSWTHAQLHHAYLAAEELSVLDQEQQQQHHEQENGSSSFVLFLSFDMAAAGGDAWSVAQVAALINRFKDRRAQFRVEDDSRPFVSTFEGTKWAGNGNWAAVRELVDGGDIFLVPDWSSLGPEGVGRVRGVVDGAFSWGAWPRASRHYMDTGEDVAYKKVLGEDKKYMMGVSPWFYTNLPQWNKNWYSSSESLWYDRWQQVLQVMPDFVQIITWNDYGESSYICDITPSQIVDGAGPYVHGFSHSAFRAVLPYFIATYKAGRVEVPRNQEDVAVAWYRTTPARAGGDGGTRWGQGGTASAASGARDVVSVMVVTRNAAASVTVDIGSRGHQTFYHAASRPVSYFEVPVAGRSGPVKLMLDGNATTGPAITDYVPVGGHVIFNAVAIQVGRRKEKEHSGRNS